MYCNRMGLTVDCCGPDSYFFDQCDAGTPSQRYSMRPFRFSAWVFNNGALPLVAGKPENWWRLFSEEVAGTRWRCRRCWQTRLPDGWRRTPRYSRQCRPYRGNVLLPEQRFREGGVVGEGDRQRYVAGVPSFSSVTGGNAGHCMACV